MSQAAVLQQPQKPQKKYVMPPIEKGMVVLWFQDDGTTVDDAVPILVTEVGNDNIGGNVIEKNMSAFIVQSGIRHKSAPRSTRPDDLQAGAWDYTPWQKKLFTKFPDLLPDVPEIDQISGRRIPPGAKVVARDPVTGNVILEQPK
jgi:hypothetical protein